MGNPLTSLDELLWEQFGKITNAAYKRYGYDKWDLAEACGKAGDIAVVGAGVYTAIGGTALAAPDLIALGGAEMAAGILWYSREERKNDRSRETEQNLILRSGAAPYHLSQRNILRPTNLLVGMAIGYVGGRYAIGATTHSITAAGLMVVATGIFMFFKTCEMYFVSQHPKPPATKKSPLKSWYEAVARKFAGAEPLPKEVPLPVKCTTIDAIAGE